MPFESEPGLNARGVEKLQVLIVAQPGAWQQILQKSVEAHSFTRVVGVAGGGLSAVQLARDAAPDVVVIDTSIAFQDILALISQMKQEHPRIRSVVLTDTAGQRRQLAQAGADYTLSSFNYESQIGPLLEQL
jgi:DNA-binding NarL/FixJ family response regulator